MVSRQRELLADAAAVQYTRHPAGLAGAFKKVGGYALGGRVLHWHAKEFGHLFFVDGEGRATPDKAGFCSAHPPLNERIRSKIAMPTASGRPWRRWPAPRPARSCR